MKKLAIVISHPIQYYSKVFELLGKQCSLMVFYTAGKIDGLNYDAGFGKTIEWDIPLLEGYNYTFVKNLAKKPGYNHFAGIKNPDLITLIGQFEPAAILVYGWAYQSHLTVMRHFKGKIPVWFRGDSTLLDDRPGLKNLSRRFFLTWVYSHIDTAFYVGTANKAYFKAMGVANYKLIHAPHAVDNDRFGQSRQEEVVKLREHLGITQNEILILYAGKFEEKKNPLILLEGFLNLNHSNTHLLFVGNGELEEKLKNTALRQTQGDNRNERIHFMDFQNQLTMPVIYQACDLFCLPSKGPAETWGLTVNEAMAAGKAVLVSDKVGCAKDLIIDKENGFVFKSENLPDLTNKLLKFERNITLEQFGRKSIEIISSWNFDRQCGIIINQLDKEGANQNK
ncbi:glycosyltransferase family 4 protein [Pedobacter sp. Leaf216]|uniref:glycosyltransferase family 4 protein n=1 Tax=Pedobacter sp. Leaf216 TaxID=1735684 RepID=UPI000A8B2F09|nr:glycosyltransferase family 4 protein [Pedobacter sp. Leaf216]